MVSIVSPQFSFIQFDASDIVESCSHPGGSMCLPVYLEDDIAFQFIARGSTVEEADAICDPASSGLVIGITRDGESTDLVFSEQPDRYRLDAYDILFNWPHGVPGFTGVVGVGECFYVIITVAGVTAVSNCLKRIPEDCYSSVLEYSSDENVFGFNYCGGSPVDEAAVECDPEFIEFTNQATMDIPYNAGMLAKFGGAPMVSVWIRNESNELQLMNVAITFDDYPANIVSIDFGGLATGVIRIS